MERTVIKRKRTFPTKTCHIFSTENSSLLVGFLTKLLTRGRCYDSTALKSYILTRIRMKIQRQPLRGNRGHVR